MRCVILYRVGDSRVDAVREVDIDGGDHISEFADMDAAISFAFSNALFQSGQADYQIVQLDEL